MTSTPDSVILAAHVDFEWWRADDARWVDYRTVSAQFALGDFDRRPRPVDDWESGEWDGTASQLDADPWLIASWGARYEPLSELPALFREFAAMPVDRHAYLAFAEAFGPLTARPDGGFPARLSFWGREHLELRYAVSLFDALGSGGTDDLEALGIVSKSSDGNPMADRRFEVAPSYAGDWDQIIESLFECSSRECDAFTVQTLRNRVSGNTEGEALERLMARRPEVIVYTYGRKDTSPRIIVRRILASLLTDAFTRHAVSTAFITDGSSLGLGIEPSYKVRDLVGALWVQLALAVAGNRTYRSCPVCGKWWDATDARSHKTVCSDNCRAKRSYRQRKAAKEEAAARDEPS